MSTADAPGSCTHWLFSQISGMVTTCPAESRPAMVRIRVSGSTVTVGYQRPNAIFGSPGTHCSLTGSKMLVLSMPVSSALCPPDTMIRPSAMPVCPEQNSIVSAGIIRAVVGGPAAGSHSRGTEPMVPEAWLFSSSYLPQPMILPVGSKLMWSGTMSHGTTGPHWPVVAAGGSGATATGDATTVSEAVAKFSV